MDYFKYIPKRPYVVAIHDIAMAGLSFILSLLLRLGTDISFAAPYMVDGSFILMAICAAIFIHMRLYKGVWRYASLPDLITLAKAVTIAILIFMFVMFFYNRLDGIPRSVPFINWFVLMALLGGPRLFYRLKRDGALHIDWHAIKKPVLNSPDPISVVMVGLSDASEHFLREMQAKQDAPYRVVAIIDDDRRNENRTVRGVPVFTDVKHTPRILRKLKNHGKTVQKFLLSPDRLDGSAVKFLLQVAEQSALTVAKLPRMTEFTSTETAKEIRPIDLEDLLGRPQRVLDRELMQKFLQGRKVLITGAGGSIGSELARQVANYSPSHLLLLDYSEYQLYAIDEEIGNLAPHVMKSPLMLDVRDRTALEAMFEEHKPEIIFHAAAIKHVPLAERHVMETLHTNVLGTRNMADLAIEYGAKAFVLISTDKAVMPSSVMGASKRAAERYCQSLALTQAKLTTAIVTVRFGNVLGSTGSVVPLFQKQLERGGPVTVTDPEMTRYFMTIREAVELVIEGVAVTTAQKLDKSSIYVLDMGEPVRILQLAEQVIRLAGRKPHEEIKIEYTGIRPGEKLHEELFYPEEEPEPTIYEGLLKAKPYQSEKVIGKHIHELEKLIEKRDLEKTLALLKKIVPQYH